MGTGGGIWISAAGTVLANNCGKRSIVSNLLLRAGGVGQGPETSVCAVVPGCVHSVTGHTKAACRLPCSKWAASISLLTACNQWMKPNQ